MTYIRDIDARQQICPLIKKNLVENQNCMGSECKMGWRFASRGSFYRDGVPVTVKLGREDPKEEASLRRLGYCGIFGKPE